MSGGALNESQREFRDRLAQRTGLDRRAIGAWMLAEENGGAAAKRLAANNHNWLNIGYFDSGAGGITKDQAFKSPTGAADATARFLQGKQFGASEGIRSILNTKGQGAAAQLAAIAGSGWASSGYGGAGHLQSLLSTRQGQAVRGVSTASGATPRTTTVPGYTGTATGVSGGQPIALPDTGGSNLAALLSSVNQKQAPVMTGGQIADPSFSATRYLSGVGAVQPVGLNEQPQSGIADQLAELTAARDTSMPAVANQASVSSQSVQVPSMTVTDSSNPSVKNAAGGAKNTLAWANSVIGTAETDGANHGPRIDQWQQAFGMSGQPWCAIFTSLATTKGGVAKSGRTASVAEVRTQATRGSAAYQKGFINPARAHAGDLILFGNDHIGLVESVSSKGIVMIAGNDSNKVQRRTVALGAGDIVRPKYR